MKLDYIFPPSIFFKKGESWDLWIYALVRATLAVAQSKIPKSQLSPEKNLKRKEVIPDDDSYLGSWLASASLFLNEYAGRQKIQKMRRHLTFSGKPCLTAWWRIYFSRRNLYLGKWRRRSPPERFHQVEKTLVDLRLSRRLLLSDRHHSDPARCATGLSAQMRPSGKSKHYNQQG